MSLASTRIATVDSGSRGAALATLDRAETIERAEATAARSDHS
jgi:hypothetical protein